MRSDKAIAIISSPFQALCALEAISHFGVENPHFIIFDDSINRPKIESVLSDYSYRRFVVPEGLNTQSLFKLTRKFIGNKVPLVFIGDYFDYNQYVIAIAVSRIAARFIYLDDGSSTLSILPPVSRPRGDNKKARQRYRLMHVLASVRFIRNSFFTIFDVGPEFPLPVIKNSFSSLVNNEGISHKGVYIIGACSHELGFSPISYEGYLKSLNDYLKAQYPEENVYYCPHRRENQEYRELIISLGWIFFQTEISVEVDFAKKGIYPLYIAGFGSSALFTLKLMYPDSRVATIFFIVKNEQQNKAYRNIETRYNNFGIELLRLF